MERWVLDDGDYKELYDKLNKAGNLEEVKDVLRSLMGKLNCKELFDLD